MTTAAQRADLITELDEMVGALTWDARNADSQAQFQRANDSTYENTAMTAARQAYADAFDALAAAGRAYATACQHGLDELRGV